MALDAARGLAYLHRKRIAWLDCKSSNVLLTRSASACALPFASCASSMVLSMRSCALSGHV